MSLIALEGFKSEFQMVLLIVHFIGIIYYDKDDDQVIPQGPCKIVKITAYDIKNNCLIQCSENASKLSLFNKCVIIYK